MAEENRTNTLTYILGIVCLMCSFLIYILFRSPSIPLVSFAREISGTSFPIIEGIILPSWIVYSLPDGLWLLSYEFCIAALWAYQYKTAGYLFFAIGLPIFAIICEVLQYPGIIHGTYDPFDVICYILAASIGILYCRIISKYYIKSNN